MLLSTTISATAHAATFTIGDGVTIKGGSDGQLIIRETLTARKARLTSDSVTPAPRDWKGVKMEGSTLLEAANE